ncbi:MAG: response regulator transcription factor [Clostridiales bacterium]
MINKILVVDDEEDIVKLLKDYFEINGYNVLTATNGTEAIVQAGKQPDLILLDVNMPKLDGIEVCKKIRDFLSCPILFLTARGEDIDKINGFRVGGDDYIVKPFSIDELGARIEAHLRCEKRIHMNIKTKFSDDLVIDYSSQHVYYKENLINLVKKEFSIVELLSKNCGQVFDKECIYEKIWGYNSEGDSSVITEHVRRIRMKFSEVGCKKYIETVWGVGYKWAK